MTAAHLHRSERPTDPAPRTDLPRVLVIDRDPDACAELVHALRLAGFGVALVSSVAEALSIIDWRPRVVVFDARLGHEAGSELLAVLRERFGVDAPGVLFAVGPRLGLVQRVRDLAYPGACIV